MEPSRKTLASLFSRSFRGALAPHTAALSSSARHRAPPSSSLQARSPSFPPHAAHRSSLATTPLSSHVAFATRKFSHSSTSRFFWPFKDKEEKVKEEPQPQQPLIQVFDCKNQADAEERMQECKLPRPSMMVSMLNGYFFSHLQREVPDLSEENVVEGAKAIYPTLYHAMYQGGDLSTLQDAIAKDFYRDLVKEKARASGASPSAPAGKILHRSLAKILDCQFQSLRTGVREKRNIFLQCKLLLLTQELMSFHSPAAGKADDDAESVDESQKESGHESKGGHGDVAADHASSMETAAPSSSTTTTPSSSFPSSSSPLSDTSTATAADPADASSSTTTTTATSTTTTATTTTATTNTNTSPGTTAPASDSTGTESATDMKNKVYVVKVVEMTLETPLGRHDEEQDQLVFERAPQWRLAQLTVDMDGGLHVAQP